jgi:hypothetical protein
MQSSAQWRRPRFIAIYPQYNAICRVAFLFGSASTSVFRELARPIDVPALLTTIDAKAYERWRLVRDQLGLTAFAIEAGDVVWEAAAFERSARSLGHLLLCQMPEPQSVLWVIDGATIFPVSKKPGVASLIGQTAEIRVCRILGRVRHPLAPRPTLKGPGPSLPRPARILDWLTQFAPFPFFGNWGLESRLRLRKSGTH